MKQAPAKVLEPPAPLAATLEKMAYQLFDFIALRVLHAHARSGFLGILVIHEGATHLVVWVFIATRLRETSSLLAATILSLSPRPSPVQGMVLVGWVELGCRKSPCFSASKKSCQLEACRAMLRTARRRSAVMSRTSGVRRWLMAGCRQSICLGGLYA